MARLRFNGGRRRLTTVVRRYLVSPVLVAVMGAVLAASFLAAPAVASPSPAFTLRPGSATDISVGANGSVWIVGTNKVADGFGIYRWNGTGWAPQTGGAFTIAVDPSGNPWITNSTGQIWHWNGRVWVQYPGTANDIAVGANGSVWIVGTNKVAGGFGIYRWNGTSWAPQTGGAFTIAVDPSGNAWITNSDAQIFHWNGTAWVLFPGYAVDISVSTSNTVWIVGVNEVPGGLGIYYWNGAIWFPVAGGAITIGADPTGNHPWVTNSTFQIFSS